MADITDPEAVTFSDLRLRKGADLIAHAYYFAKLVNDEWFATGMSAKITNTSDPIVDGSATDGRHPITGADATNMVTRCMDLVTDMEANSNAKLNVILGVAVNPDS